MVAFPNSPGHSVTLVTFGDSMLDCAHYNAHRLDPGRLLVRNEDRLFPEFQGRDLTSRGPAQLEHRATDGATVYDLPRQARGLNVQGPAVALLTIGGNDLLEALLYDGGRGLAAFDRRLEAFLAALPIRPVLVGNVYDPTFGDDANNVLGVSNPARARTNFSKINAILAHRARMHGVLVDLHTHFLGGDPGWFTSVIEPSLRGASEIRRCFAAALGL